MKILSTLYDKRINSWNIFVQSTFGEYLSFADKINTNNELQRKRVKTSKTIYSLLKSDLESGCLMPSLVLATVGKLPVSPESISAENLLKYIQQKPNQVLILDGLQRTYTLLDAAKELKSKDDGLYEQFCQYPIRIELYAEINKFGILYRMLTLNTGQTPMSSRHQLEMLYNDLLNTEIDGVTLISDTLGKADPDDNEIVFQNAIEGFNSYMNRTALPIDRQELLENIKMLEKMSEEDTSSDLFKSFLECYIKLFTTLRKISSDHVIDAEEMNHYEITGSPFARKASKIFSTSQALTGFGAAVGKLKDFGIINGFQDIENLLSELEENNDGIEWMMELLVRMDRIRNTSKKIGNAQRTFFQFFFRELLNKEGDSFLKLQEAVVNGYDKYYIQVN